MEENSAPSSPTIETGTPQPVVIKNGFVNKRNIATLIGVAVFLIALISALLIIKGQQDIRDKAGSGGECSRSEDCKFLENPGNEGSFEASRPISNIFITAKDYYRYDPGESDDGCYDVKIRDRFLEWKRFGSGPNCKDISNIQVWTGGANGLNSGSIGSTTCEDWNFLFNHPLDQKASVNIEVNGNVVKTEDVPATTDSTTTISGKWDSKLKTGDKVVFKIDYLGQASREIVITSCETKTATPSGFPASKLGASCTSVKAYTTDWKALTLDDLKKLKAGDSIRFAVIGTTTAGIFDKARFSVNGAIIGESDLKKDGGEEFYIDYTLPDDTKSIKVDAQLHHNQVGWF